MGVSGNPYTWVSGLALGQSGDRHHKPVCKACWEKHLSRFPETFSKLLGAKNAKYVISMCLPRQADCHMSEFDLSVFEPKP